MTWQLAMSGVVVGGIAGAVALGAISPVLTVVVLIALVAGFAQLFRLAGPQVVTGPTWRFRGVPISGRGFRSLEDIDGRFVFAERIIKEIPAGIAWDDVAQDVNTLRWEAAEQAASLSALDVELADLRYAAAGTPQMALRRQLDERAHEHLGILAGIQANAEDLARVAGNALAAAKVALARTGDLARLQVATPSRQAIVATAALAETKARLALLADAWTELDDSGLLAQEALGLAPIEPPSANSEDLNPPAPS